MKRILLLTLLLFTGSAKFIAQTIVINEINADSPTSTETEEFIELYGPANASLNGYTLAFCQGTDQTYYYSINLNNQSLDANGFFVVGSAGVSGVDVILPTSTIENGYDAIALYNGPSNLYNVGSSVVATNLVDLAIYETADANINALNIALGFTPTSFVAFEESNGTSSGDLSQSRIQMVGLPLRIPLIRIDHLLQELSIHHPPNSVKFYLMKSMPTTLATTSLNLLNSLVHQTLP
jgi:hypothetical protein